MREGTPIQAPGLRAAGIEHGFGTRAGAGAPEVLRRATQVHGIALRLPGAEPSDADGILSATGEAAAGVVTADCLPVLLADTRTGTVAAVHAGWRGLTAGILERAVEALQAQGADPAHLRAALGPAIGRCCFEIGPEVAERFVEFAGAETIEADAGQGRPHGDLALAARIALQRAGLEDARIEAVSPCTFCTKEQGSPRFHSYRRDQRGRPEAPVGRQISWVAPL